MIHLLSVTRFGGGNKKIIAWFLTAYYNLLNKIFEFLFHFMEISMLGRAFGPEGVWTVEAMASVISVFIYCRTVYVR